MIYLLKAILIFHFLFFFIKMLHKIIYIIKKHRPVKPFINDSFISPATIEGEISPVNSIASNTCIKDLTNPIAPNQKDKAPNSKTSQTEIYNELLGFSFITLKMKKAIEVNPEIIERENQIFII